MTRRPTSSRDSTQVAAAPVPAVAAPIAVLGASGRFPGAADRAALWALLRSDTDGVSTIPAERWTPTGATEAFKWIGSIPDAERFDAAFFGISPREAHSMDPQQRVLLEEAWRCIEDAGVPLEDLQTARTGVWIGAMASDHLNRVVAASGPVDSYAALGTYECVLANRVSHVLRLSGPSLAVNGACASSLLAIHAACRALERGDCDYALAGAVNLNLHPFKFEAFGRSRMLSPNGRCRTFAADADGYVPGDGVALVLLMRADRAAALRRRVLGLVIGAAVNHCGGAASLTAPRLSAQRSLIEAAWADAGIDPRTIGYIEAHGTGTSLGDPIEVEALSQAFTARTRDVGFCALGSAKANLGHCEAAAGMAGFCKVLAMFAAGEIPPLRLSGEPNPVLMLEHGPFRIPTDLEAWPRGTTPRRAGISSFGFGGANAHLVLEEPPLVVADPSLDSSATGSLPLVLSARTALDLAALLERWETYLTNGASGSIINLCATLATARVPLAVRRSALVRTHAELRERLNAWRAELSSTTPRPSATRPLGLRFGAVTTNQARRLRSALVAWPTLATVVEIAEDELGLSASTRGKSADAQARRTLAVTVAWGRALETLGVTVTAVAASSAAGRSAALVASGAMTLASVLTEIPAHRPRVSLALPGQSAPLAPVVFDGNYLRLLMRETIDSTAVATLMAQAARLYQYQFTFRRHVDEWTPLLKTTGAITDPIHHRTPELQRAVLVALLSCWRRLDRKWELSERPWPVGPELLEIVELVTAGVMSPEQWVALALGHSEPEAIAAALNAAAARLERLPLLADHLDQRAVPELDAPAGEGAHPVIDVEWIDIDGSLADTAEPLLTQLCGLWEQGVAVRWSPLFPSGSFQPWSLPTYPFASAMVPVVAGDGTSQPPKTPAVIPPTSVVHHELDGGQPGWIRRIVEAALAQGRAVGTPPRSSFGSPSSSILEDLDAAAIAARWSGVQPHRGSPPPILSAVRRIRRGTGATVASLDLGALSSESDPLDAWTRLIEVALLVPRVGVAQNAVEMRSVEVVVTMPPTMAVAVYTPGAEPGTIDVSLETPAHQRLARLIGVRWSAVHAQSTIVAASTETPAAILVPRWIPATLHPPAMMRVVVVLPDTIRDPFTTALAARVLEISTTRNWTMAVATVSTVADRLSRLGAGGVPPVVVQLGALASTTHDDPSHDLVAQLEPRLGEVLATLRSLPPIPCRLITITRAAHRVVASDRGEGWLAAGHGGLLRSARLEWPTLRTTTVDVAQDADVEACALALLAALAAPGPAELAWRDGRLLSRTFIQTPSSDDVAEWPLDDRASCLVVGGTGGIGRHLLRDLWRQHRARVVIVGRTAPDREVAQALDAEAAAHGGTWRFIAADLSMPATLTSAVAAAVAAHGPLQGVFHCGGVLRDGLLRGKSWNTVAEVLAPKSSGTWALHLATLDQPLRLFACCSSVVAVLGNLGQGDYAAANAIQDAFVAHRAALGAPGASLSVGWTLWQDGGMGLSPAVQRRFAARTGLLDHRQGLAAWRRAAKSGEPHAVITGDATAFTATWRAQEIFSDPTTSERPAFTAHSDSMPKVPR